jgi:hypothetical protein
MAPPQPPRQPVPAAVPFSVPEPAPRPQQPPPAAAPPGFVQTGPSAGTEIGIKKKAEEFYGPEEGKKYDSAQHTQFLLNQMKTATDYVNSNSRWLQTGAGIEARTEAAKYLNSILSSAGLPAAVDPANIANIELVMKNSFNLATASLNQAFGGSREAGFIIQKAAQSVPNAENTPLGFQLVWNSYNQAAQREIDLHHFKSHWAQTHDGNLMGAEEKFNSQYTPSLYAERASSQVRPRDFRSLQETKNLLPGTMFRLLDTPPGKALVVPGPSTWTPPNSR